MAVMGVNARHLLFCLVVILAVWTLGCRSAPVEAEPEIIRLTGCAYGGKEYKIGSKFYKNPCTVCTCKGPGLDSCETFNCEDVFCLNGALPVVRYGECCGLCPEDSFEADFQEGLSEE